MIRFYETVETLSRDDPLFGVHFELPVEDRSMRVRPLTASRASMGVFSLWTPEAFVGTILGTQWDRQGIASRFRKTASTVFGEVPERASAGWISGLADRF
jgi:hypothetical protein